MSTVRAQLKLLRCLELAKQASRASWQGESRNRNAYRQVRIEAMEDARYWRKQLTVS
jgi:hypothetical protein